LIDIETHTLTSAPSASQPLLRGLNEQVGFVPNLAGRMSGSPALLEAFLKLRECAAKGSLDAATRELAAIAVNTETGFTYGVAAHSTFALKMGAAAADVAAARNGRDPADPKLGALLRFVRAIARRGPDVADRAREALAQGYGPSDLLDTLAAIAVPMLATSVNQLAAVPLDAAFEPQAWRKSA
jgi:AhpD family alkylhydroperoxidase